MPVVGNGTERTVMDVVEEVRRYLEGSVPGRVNILDGSIDSTTETLVLLDEPKGISEGTLIEVGLEQMYVRSFDVPSKTLSVIRNWGATPTSTHDDRELVKIAPSYHAYDIYMAVLDEITSLNGSGLVAHETVELTTNTSDHVYDTGIDVATRIPLRIAGAIREASQVKRSWRPIRVELLKNLATEDFPSGYGFKLLEPWRSGSSLIRVTVATTFGRPLTPTSEISEDALGTAVSVVPIVAVGAAWRMLLGKEAQRLNPDHSHGSRRAEEIQPGSIAFLGRSLQRMKEDLIELAVERQVAEYGYRVRV